MSYNIKSIEVFEKQTKRLHKKYPSIKKDLLQLIKTLKVDPEQGTTLGKDCYKIRMAIASKNKGKSGGARVITCVKIINETVYLLSIYDKSDQDSISDKELVELVKQIP